MPSICGMGRLRQSRRSLKAFRLVEHVLTLWKVIGQNQELFRRILLQ
jgi:hypothetical protein